MYQTRVTEIGPIVEEFEEEGLLILFGPSATPELKEICVVHESGVPSENVIHADGVLKIGKQEYRITQVGTEDTGRAARKINPIVDASELNYVQKTKRISNIYCDKTGHQTSFVVAICWKEVSLFRSVFQHFTAELKMGNST